MRRWGLVGLLILLMASGAWAQAARPDGSVFAAGVTTVAPMGALYATAPPAIADGSVGLPRMDVNRNLQINCLNCAGAAGGTSATDKAGFTGGTSSFTPVGGAFDDVATSTLSEGQLGILRLTSFRAVHVNLRDNSGNEITSLGGGSQYAQGAVAGNTDLMTMAGCVRVDSAAIATGVAAGDVSRCSVDATGRLWVHVGVVDGTVAATQSGAWSVGQTGTWTVQPGNTANTTAWLVTGTGGTFPATQSGTWNMRMQDGAGNALTSLSLGAQRAITVSILDGSGNQVTAFSGSGGTASNFTSAIPSAGTAAGFSDGTNMQMARVADCDTGAGAFYCLAINLVKRTNGTPTELIGQAAMAASLPVTLASDQSTLTVTGAGGTFPATQSGTWNIGTVTAVTAITNALPAGTNVIGVTGVAQGSTTSGQSGGLTQGAVTTAAPTYTTAQTSPLSLQTDGSLRTAVTNTVTVGSHAVTNAGTFAVQAAQSGTWTATVTQATGTNLHVVCDSGCSTSTAPADNSAFTAGSTSSSPASGFYHATRDSMTDGRIGAIAINVNRAQLIQLENSAKTEIGTQTAPIGVRFTDGTNFITPSTVDTDDGTIAGGQANVSLVASLGYLSDGTNWTSRMQQAAHGTNSTGAGIQLGALVGEFDDTSPTACTENQFCNVRMSTNRNVYNTIRDAAGNERGANVNASNQLSVSVDNTVTVGSHAVTNAGTFAVQSASQGTLAHDAAASAVNPVLIGGFASAAAPSDVSADVDAVRAWHLRSGAYVVQPSYAGILAATGSGASGTGTPRVMLSSDSALAANQSVNVAQMNGVATTMGNGVAGTGVQRVAIASDNTAFSVNAIESGTWTVQPGNTANTTPWLVQTVAGATGGAVTCSGPSASGTNATTCKASAGTLYGYEVFNTTTTIYYLRLYNLASGPTCSSATGFMRSIPIPPATAAGGAGGAVRDFTIGEVFNTGIGFCLTGGGSSTDNTSVPVGLYLSLLYK
jgi:hypothetical protein